MAGNFPAQDGPGSYDQPITLYHSTLQHLFLQETITFTHISLYSFFSFFRFFRSHQLLLFFIISLNDSISSLIKFLNDNFLVTAFYFASSQLIIGSILSNSASVENSTLAFCPLATLSTEAYSVFTITPSESRRLISN